MPPGGALRSGDMSVERPNTSKGIVSAPGREVIGTRALRESFAWEAGLVDRRY